jgi:hypothetical protein
MLRENELSPLGKTAIVLLLVAVALSAAANVGSGHVPHPYAFAIVLFGFTLFLIAKLSVVGWKKWISIGTGLMSANMADLYRVGYWFMAVGVLATFAPW